MFSTWKFIVDSSPHPHTRRLPFLETVKGKKARVPNNWGLAQRWLIRHTCPDFFSAKALLCFLARNWVRKVLILTPLVHIQRTTKTYTRWGKGLLMPCTSRQPLLCFRKKTQLGTAHSNFEAECFALFFRAQSECEKYWFLLPSCTFSARKQHVGHRVFVTSC